MSNENYREIAAIFNKHGDTWPLELVQDFAVYFAQDNPLFDRAKFMAACHHWQKG